jgi:myo-inositol-1(or 4)-monophosphatase
MILSASSTPITSLSTKKNSADLVTETDRAVEALISKTLMSKYPTFKFYGEETFKPGTQLTDHPTFIVDPIDGTTNFVHGYPYYCVSLGFACSREPRVGVVFNPITGIMYTGVQGEGSYRIDTRLPDDDATRRRKLPLRPAEPLRGLSRCLVAIEFGSDRAGPNWECKVATWANLGKSTEQGGAMIHSAHALGSAALNLCAVASGEMDLYWEGGCWAWDVCAGWVILGEAGGIVVDGNKAVWEEREVQLDHRKYLAVRGGEGQREIVEEFWGHVVGEMDYVS